MEVEAGTGKDGVEVVDSTAFQVIAAQPMFSFHMADDWLDRHPALHFTFDRGRDAAALVGQEHA